MKGEHNRDRAVERLLRETRRDMAVVSALCRCRVAGGLERRHASGGRGARNRGPRVGVRPLSVDARGRLLEPSLARSSPPSRSGTAGVCSGWYRRRRWQPRSPSGWPCRAIGRRHRHRQRLNSRRGRRSAPCRLALGGWTADRRSRRWRRRPRRGAQQGQQGGSGLAQLREGGQQGTLAAGELDRDVSRTPRRFDDRAPGSATLRQQEARDAARKEAAAAPSGQPPSSDRSGRRGKGRQTRWRRQSRHRRDPTSYGNGPPRGRRRPRHRLLRHRRQHPLLRRIRR